MDIRGCPGFGVDLRGELSYWLNARRKTHGKGDNLTVLMALVETQSHPNIMLPLYQLLARLNASPRHSETLASWKSDNINRAGSSGHASGSSAQDEFPIESHVAPSSFIIEHLLSIISSNHAGKRQNSKLLEAAIDLLASLVKGQPKLARDILSWSSHSRAESSESAMPLSPGILPPKTPEIIDILLELLNSGPTPVRIAAAGW
jgi:hypothetical protein